MKAEHLRSITILQNVTTQMLLSEIADLLFQVKILVLVQLQIPLLHVHAVEQVPLKLNVLTLFAIVRKYQLIMFHVLTVIFLLNERHRYYVQVQLQMFTLGVKYCDFIVWSPSDMIVIRVLFNENFAPT